MRLLAFLLLCLSLHAHAQEPEDSCDAVYTLVEVMPELPEGDIMKYIRKNLELSINEGDPVCYTFHASFIIDKTGKVRNVEIVETQCPKLGEDVRRCIENMPQSKPGKVNGSPVCTQFSIPIKVNIK